MPNRSGSLISPCKPVYLFCIFFISGSFFFSPELHSARLQEPAGQQEPARETEADQIIETDQEPARETEADQEPVPVTEADQEPVRDTQPEADLRREVTSTDIKRGERLFRGLVPLGPDAASCVSCHHTAVIDTFSWNPPAYEIARLYSDRDVAALRTVVLEPVTMKMTEVHTGYDISDEAMFQIKAFMDDLAAREVSERPVITSTLIFIGLLLVIMGVLADLIIFKIIPYKLVHLVLILASGFFITDMIVFEAIALGRSPFYEPHQPIKFSHQVHVHDNRTDCLYCHSTAEYSSSAGIPATAQCMNCHIIIREGTHSGRFEINKLVEAYENRMPVRWVRVYALPNHVHFSHAGHVGAAGLDCAECHGDVEQMNRIVQVHDMSMGWCLDCHRSAEVDIFNNEFYSDYELLREDLRAGRIDLVTARDIGGTDCMKCHY
jgi:hypothetical protein